jgi:hypothetical protein
VRRRRARPADWEARHVPRLLTRLLVAQTRKRRGDMSTPEENIKTILADWLDALARQTETMS